MSENPKEEKLSFKEQILRDLERVKKQDRSEQENEITSFETPSSPENSVGSFNSGQRTFSRRVDG